MNLKEMIKGWFIGAFEPTAFKTDVCEVAVHDYKAGTFITAHHHKIATEITLIIKGKVKMFDNIYTDGDIIIIKPNTGNDFEVFEDTKTVIVKIPGALNDKYEGVLI